MYLNRDIQKRASEMIAGTRRAAPFLSTTQGLRQPSRRQNAKIERTYTTSTVMHFALEPLNGLAFEKDGILEIHTGNQWQTLILPRLATALGRSPGQDRAPHLLARWRIWSPPRR